MYRDRAAAGRALARELERFRAKTPVVVALPRGGVVVGYEVAKALGAPLEVIIVRKLGAPHQPELAIGAVVDLGRRADSPEVVLNEAVVKRLGVSSDFIREETARELEEIRRREAAYRAGGSPAPLAGRTVIVVDDGIATGSSMRVALHALRRAGPERLVLAVPVGPRESLDRMKQDADEVVCPLTPEDFHAVGEFYADFAQTSDEEVITLLSEARARPTETPP